METCTSAIKKKVPKTEQTGGLKIKKPPNEGIYYILRGRALQKDRIDQSVTQEGTQS